MTCEEDGHIISDISTLGELEQILCQAARTKTYSLLSECYQDP